MTLFELSEKFPNEQAAREWFELLRWDGQRQCGHCQSEKTKKVPREKPMPYWSTAKSISASGRGRRWPRVICRSRNGRMRST